MASLGALFQDSEPDQLAQSKPVVVHGVPGCAFFANCPKTADVCNLMSLSWFDHGPTNKDRPGKVVAPEGGRQ